MYSVTLTNDRLTRVVSIDGNAACWTLRVVTQPQIHTTTAEYMTIAADYRLLHLTTTCVVRQHLISK